MSSKTRLWVLITGFLCVLVVLYGVLVGLMPQLSDASRTHARADEQAVLVQAQQAQLTVLQQADRDFEELNAELRELEAAIPVASDWSRFLRELAGFEAATGARITELVVADEVLPVSPVEAPPADPAAEGTVAETPSETAPTQDGSASGAGTGLIEIPITVTVSGTPDQIAQFFRQLQTGERLVFISGVEIDSTGETPSGVLSGLIYVVPGATTAD